MVKNMICLSYKYIWVVIFARISHGQVGRSTEVSASWSNENPSVGMGM